MKKNPAEFTRVISEFVAGTKPNDIPQPVFEHAKVALLDWLAVTIAGKDDPLVLKLIRYADLMGGHQQATILGYPFKKSASQAALINGSASHALDYDDTLKPFLGHPSVTLFPALGALAEWKEKTGSDFLTAYIVGLQTGATIGASAGLDHYAAGWHSTSTIGHLAAAAGCANLLGLDENQTAQALGIAGTQACGLKRVFGTMCKPFHAGRSSEAGLVAALLASDGFTSAEDILEGPHGFFHVLRGAANEHFLAGLGTVWYIEYLAQKYHASCHFTHSPIEAALAIVEKEKLSIDQIKAVRIRSSQISLDAAGKLEPVTGLEAKFSIPFCVANAVVKGNTGMQAFADENVNDPRIREFMKKISISLDESIQALNAKVTIETTEGHEHSASSDVLEEIPDFETKRTRVLLKFNDLCSSVLGDRSTEDICDQILTLEKLKNVKELVEKAGG